MLSEADTVVFLLTGAADAGVNATDVNAIAAVAAATTMRLPFMLAPFGFPRT